jgi:hypothetical protein
VICSPLAHPYLGHAATLHLLDDAALLLHLAALDLLLSININPRRR